jgi:hypothetical protein
MTERSRDYRIRIMKEGSAYATYLCRKGSRVFYIDGEEVPLALSDLLGGAAAETRFRLEDVLDGRGALVVIREALLKKFVSASKMPRVDWMV